MGSSKILRRDFFKRSIETVASVGNAHSPTNDMLTIPQADVAAGAQKTYSLSDNGTGHTHQ